MGLKEFIKNSIILFKLARKPSKDEFLLALRITLIGVAVIGVIAFIIRFVALAIQGV
ncbi:MAG: protein translocase SEC61 complex subunit gamma [Thaumarchaeota archaeon]|nr:protein translocase SEC61 complex subunit gamma [Candidatus Geocrenenecus arthurdayi]MCL7389570.1 protein translocase SEC61 complex subunit gamma [Candidatus Geocrenenecus arthurdayi]MCL7391871.1 protein translocase SEC61 complex subunit gamma [Candidatus Geocrenenecus arthurdayi]MCL7397251.1 protein translocase SEC61 complex subunit gamma [Candidatus Geocrenenecus arthurdayi]MCL7401709.1 protein translocase SEC61 complex subunit gamma [Candidatus Geocrenenecus arthurdayi]